MARVKTIYISGPMRGLENYNFAAFDEAARQIRLRGDLVLNPAERGRAWLQQNGNRDMTGAEYERLMCESFNDVRKSDGIFLLRGWEKSVGAKRELSVALINLKEIEVQQ